VTLLLPPFGNIEGRKAEKQSISVPLGTSNIVFGKFLMTTKDLS